MRFLPLFSGAALLMVTGVLHGLWTDRWSLSPQLSAAGARLETVPLRSGDWEAEPVSLDERQLSIGRITASLCRRYRNPHTGAEVLVLVVCGRSGQIAVHTPDICYQGAGFEMASDPSQVFVPEGEEHLPLWWASFHKPGPPAETLRIFWGWGTDGTWQASDSPRLDFARSPYLYKLYVVHRLPNPKQPVEADPSLDLLRVLLPDLRRSLTPPG